MVLTVELVPDFQEMGTRMILRLMLIVLQMAGKVGGLILGRLCLLVDLVVVAREHFYLGGAVVMPGVTQLERGIVLVRLTVADLIILVLIKAILPEFKQATVWS